VIASGTATSHVHFGARREWIRTHDSWWEDIDASYVSAPGSPSPAFVIDGATLTQGETTTINGDTVVLSSTDLVVASGTATSTEGLGGAIMSGLGASGVSATAAGSTSAPVPKGAAPRLRKHPLMGTKAMCAIAAILVMVI
jgi:hypothetical protein